MYLCNYLSGLNHQFVLIHTSMVIVTMYITPQIKSGAIASDHHENIHGENGPKRHKKEGTQRRGGGGLHMLYV